MLRNSTVLLTVVGIMLSINLCAQQRISSKGFAVHCAGGVFEPYNFTRLLKFDGQLAIVGIPAFDYFVTNNIYPQVEIIAAADATINQAYKNVLDGKVKFRYVIDMSTLQ